jgi:hypothetical protein
MPTLYRIFSKLLLHNLRWTLSIYKAPHHVQSVSNITLYFETQKNSHHNGGRLKWQKNYTPHIVLSSRARKQDEKYGIYGI